MSVVPAERDLLVIDMTIEPGYALSKNVVKAVLIPQGQRLEYVTLDDPIRRVHRTTKRAS